MDVQTTLNTYAELMTLIKSRLNILIDVAYNHRQYPEWAVVEFTQLQIRLICETFAMACLVAHGDLTQSHLSTFRDAYRADFIMNQLGKLHAYFYPRPTKQTFAEGRVVGWDEAIEITDFMTKDQLLKFYHEADNLLHMGSLDDAVTRTKKTFDLTRAIRFQHRLVALLDHHNIYLADSLTPNEVQKARPDGTPIPKRQIVAMMQSSQRGRVSTHLFVRVDDPVRSGPSPQAG